MWVKKFLDFAAVLIGVVLLGLGGCADSESRLNARVGESEQQLVAQLGPPSAARQQGDARLLTYVFHQTAELPASGPTPWEAAFTQWTQASSPDGFGAEPAKIVITGTCVTQYRLTEGAVRSWTRSGSGC